MKNKHLITFLIWLVIQCAATVGALMAASMTQQDAIAEVLQRISLDTSKLDLGDDNLPAVADRSEVKHYIALINDYLDNQSLPLTVISINGIVAENSGVPSKLYETELLTNEQPVDVVLAVKPLYTSVSISFIAIASAFFYLLFPIKPTGSKVASNVPANIRQKPVYEEVVLHIDLKAKALFLDTREPPVVMQNKPFCFYVALLRYCISHPAAPLSHQHPVPDELAKTANETFARLIELGHTKRKRPDFKANLDKTLSEVRASLDELFANAPTEKRRYYPPRALGEGSRSKQHSYALRGLTNEDVRVIEN